MLWTVYEKFGYAVRSSSSRIEILKPLGVSKVSSSMPVVAMRPVGWVSPMIDDLLEALDQRTKQLNCSGWQMELCIYMCSDARDVCLIRSLRTPWMWFSAELPAERESYACLRDAIVPQLDND